VNAAIIPAYNPDLKLIELTASLYKKGVHNVIVVNDGSDERTKEIFAKLGAYVTVLTHDSNLGKGAAIKTDLKHADHLPGLQGVVVLDADGQHRPEDAICLLDQLKNTGSGLVLGVRRFDGRIPIRSLIENTITKYVFLPANWRGIVFFHYRYYNSGTCLFLCVYTGDYNFNDRGSLGNLSDFSKTLVTVCQRKQF
jgi:glycosyltransferase involved in cell wall biosynthesis